MEDASQHVNNFVWGKMVYPSLQRSYYRGNHQYIYNDGVVSTGKISLRGALITQEAKEWKKDRSKLIVETKPNRNMDSLLQLYVALVSQHKQSAVPPQRKAHWK
ncbi:hypothetical protein OsJ_18613 [Oryza sativa Japonica Group]|uniref:Uncharacterized protein n=2 Tax=Oryza TaxID=4527 RepID=B9FIX2_ORYSJ|nr:hypothetical protein OsJ_18613 [Oryza sativa Japonica Group]